MSMTFDDLSVYKAVYDVYAEIEESKRSPRSADWFIFSRLRDDLLGRIKEALGEVGVAYIEQCRHAVTDIDEYLLKCWDRFGKRAVCKKGAGLKLMVEVYRRQNCVCWHGSLTSDAARYGVSKYCSQTPVVERLRPDRGFVADNCVISCTKCAAKARQ